MEWQIGTKAQLAQLAPELVIAVDLGFSRRATTGLAWRTRGSTATETRLSTFPEAISVVALLLRDKGGTLILEAPLSGRFDAEGVPARRGEFERHRASGTTATRYWYSGPGASTCLAAHFFLTRLAQLSAELDTPRTASVVLYEGFLSFKANGPKDRADHVQDAHDLLGAFLDPATANLYRVDHGRRDRIESLAHTLDLTADPTAPLVLEPKQHRPAKRKSS